MRSRWTGISVPESEGGAGLSFLEEMLVAEELGRALYPGPFLASVVTALPALREAGASELAAAVVAGERIATVAWFGIERPDDPDASPATWDGRALSCHRLFVPNLSTADLDSWATDPSLGVGAVTVIVLAADDLHESRVKELRKQRDNVAPDVQHPDRGLDPPAKLIDKPFVPGEKRAQKTEHMGYGLPGPSKGPAPCGIMPGTK